ncbi:hypothetical protein GGS21DRAFT_542078 [Xylaria nigripes]|nr:hypothetical protein GGS21DRAFT_542078 [Xylaria nigripes]
MAPSARALRRNAFIYDLRDPSTIMGGLRKDGQTLPNNADPLLPGKYLVSTNATVHLSGKIPLNQCLSFPEATRVRSFQDEVRARDGRCVVTKVENLRRAVEIWDTFEAAHIFPLAYSDYWTRHNFSHWITILTASAGPIKSVQNGSLIRFTIRGDFVQCNISIDPDVGFSLPLSHALAYQYSRMIIYIDNVAGTKLDRRLLEDERRPADELLRWHCRQAVLTNRRGLQSPPLRTIFPQVQISWAVSEKAPSSEFKPHQLTRGTSAG